MASTDDNRRSGQQHGAPENWPSNWTVQRVAETGSTNTDLFLDAERGARHHTALLADNQTAGRGRLDRTWEAKSGANLLLSLLFRNPQSKIDLCQRTVAVAAIRACRKFLVEPTTMGGSITLKWPNDLLLDQRKFGGMLSIADSAKSFIVVGIGINIAWAPEYAAKLNDLAVGGSCNPIELLRVLLEQIDLVEKFSVQELHDEYVHGLSTLDKMVRVELTNGETISGRAIALDQGGRLIVQSHAGEHVIDTGDVVHLRDANHD